MRVLALDTSTEACSVALLADGELRMRCEVTERSHAELILPMVHGLLVEAALTLGDLDGLALGRGPGGFTGLRIGAGVVQGLAFGGGLPVALVSSLAAVAAQVQSSRGEAVLVCNDARMQEVYWGVYRAEVGGGLRPLTEECVSRPDQVLFEAFQPAHVAGNALARYSVLRSRLVASALRIHDGIYPRADAVARLGEQELAAGRGVPAEQVLPTYVRDDVARPAELRVTGMS